METSQARIAAENLARGRSLSFLQDLGKKGGFYSDVASAEAQRQGFTAKQFTTPLKPIPVSAPLSSSGTSPAVGMLADRVVRGRDTGFLQEISKKGGVYNEAAQTELRRQAATVQARSQGFIPKVGNSPVSRPYADPPKPLSFAQRPTTPVSQPTAASSSLTPVAAGVATTAAVVGTGALALGAVVTAAGLVTSGLLLKNADALGDLAKSKLGEKEAKDKLQKASDRYEKALLERQKANLFNSKGSSATSSNPLPSNTPVAPFNSIGKAGGWYRVYTTQSNPNGITLKESDANGGLSSNSTYSWEYASAPPTSEIRLTLNGVTGNNEGADGSNIFSVNWYFVANGFTAKQYPPLEVRPDSYTPPLDKPIDRGDLKDPNNPYSPSFLPWLPTVSINQAESFQVERLPDPANDNRPFKEPIKPDFAPSPVSPVSPTQQPVSTIANTSPAFSIPKTTNPATNPNSGIKPAFESKAFESPAFVSKAYVSGTSNPNDAGKSIDNSTGLERKPVSTTPIRTDVSPSQSQNPLTNPLNPPVTAKPQTTPNSPASPDLGTIALGITGLGIATGTVLTGIDALKNLNNQINAQTTPQAQKANVAEGMCNATQPNQCARTNIENAVTSATNPIKDIANDNKGALLGLANLLATIWEFLQNRIGLVLANLKKISDFLDLNAKVESVKSTITLALTLHNALMLSSNLTTTLGAIIDNVLSTFGNTFKTTEGTTVSASEFLGASVKNWIIGIIGVENYVALTDALATANRIYQAGINVLSTVQSILDSAASVAQATGINVAKIGNAIRDDGVINPKSYAHMDDSKAGNRPTTLSRFEQLTTTISDFDTKAQNLVTITAAPVQIKDAVKQSKEDIKAFNDARDVNSTANQEAKAAKLEEIKTLKAVTEAVISKKDDDT